MGIDADHVSQQNEQLRTTGMLVIPESPSVYGEVFWAASPSL